MRLITRRHLAGATRSAATYSPCETYRYELERVWEPHGRVLNYVMLNPSRATEAQNDPTVERCERRARALGFGGFAVTNLFALRETDPRAMRRHPHPEGPANAQIVKDVANRADTVLAAWGFHGAHLGQGAAVASLLRDCETPVCTLGLTKAGHPRHPLYVAYAQPLIPWAEPDFSDEKSAPAAAKSSSKTLRPPPAAPKLSP